MSTLRVAPPGGESRGGACARAASSGRMNWVRWPRRRRETSCHAIALQPECGGLGKSGEFATWRRREFGLSQNGPTSSGCPIQACSTLAGGRARYVDSRARARTATYITRCAARNTFGNQAGQIERGCYDLSFFPRVRTRTETPSDSTGPASASASVGQRPHVYSFLFILPARSACAPNVGMILHFVVAFRSLNDPPRPCRALSGMRAIYIC